MGECGSHEDVVRTDPRIYNVGTRSRFDPLLPRLRRSSLAPWRLMLTTGVRAVKAVNVLIGVSPAHCTPALPPRTDTLTHTGTTRTSLLATKPKKGRRTPREQGETGGNVSVGHPTHNTEARETNVVISARRGTAHACAGDPQTGGYSDDIDANVDQDHSEHHVQKTNDPQSCVVP